MHHFLNGDNNGLMICRQQSSFNFQHVFVTNLISDMCSVSLQTKETGYAFPLYLNHESTEKKVVDKDNSRKPNLHPEIIKQITDQLDLQFTDEKQDTNNTFAPIDLLDYIYAILHSPRYRETYQEFLKIDFPRVPYPDKNTFWQLVKLGGELRQIHLLESSALEKTLTSYPEDGDNIISRKINKADFAPHTEDKTLGQLWINDQQYFDGVPVIAWEFYIGGYQPAQKWLKDRRNRTLDYEDIQHYQQIIVALCETHRIMQVIDKIKIT